MLAISIAFICYLLILGSYFLPAEKALGMGMHTTFQKNIFTILLVNALVAHFFVFFPHLMRNSELFFSFANTLALSSWVISLLYFISTFRLALINIGLAVIPSNLVILIFYAFQHESASGQYFSPLIASHIVTSIIAFSLLIIAAIQAVTLSIQAKTLHKHHSSVLITRLPPYFQMEKVLFELIDLGVIFLSLALITGFIFLDDIFAQHVAHKTVLSIIAWFIFIILSIGRRLWGWQSRTLIRLTISASLLLFIGFLGSKLILELISK